MSNLNHESVTEQIWENLAEELGRDPTDAEIASEIEARDFEIE